MDDKNKFNNYLKDHIEEISIREGNKIEYFFTINDLGKNVFKWNNEYNETKFNNARDFVFNEEHDSISLLFGKRTKPRTIYILSRRNFHYFIKHFGYKRVIELNLIESLFNDSEESYQHFIEIIQDMVRLNRVDEELMYIINLYSKNIINDNTALIHEESLKKLYDNLEQILEIVRKRDDNNNIEYFFTDNDKILGTIYFRCGDIFDIFNFIENFEIVHLYRFKYYINIKYTYLGTRMETKAHILNKKNLNYFYRLFPNAEIEKLSLIENLLDNDYASEKTMIDMLKKGTRSNRLDKNLFKIIHSFVKKREDI